MRRNRSIFLSLFLIPTLSYSQIIVFDSGMHHLRNGDKVEWKEFSNRPAESKVIVHFNTRKNPVEYALSLQQYDVKQFWRIVINNQVIDSLEVDGNNMKTYYSIPVGVLTDGENELRIEAATDIIDDIDIGRIIIEQRPVLESISQSHFELEVWEDQSLIPAHITIVNSSGVLQTVTTKAGSLLAVRPGVVYTGNGKASFDLAAGDYQVYAGRGFEYSVDSFQFSLRPGETMKRRFQIKKEVETRGWVSCDTHIHTLTRSGHGDASETERLITIAGEGIELPIITEHNLIADPSSLAKSMKLDQYFTVVPGDEVTTPVGHFNYFPLSTSDAVPNYKVNNWDSLGKSFADKQNKIIVLNHARDIHNGFRPFDPSRHISIAGKSLQGGMLPANAMEVVNSGALLTDWMSLFEDWFGLLNRGLHITPVGGSDSHDVARYLVGQGRTYIKAKDDDPAKIPVKEAVQNLKDGRVMVSFGLLAEVEVADKYGPGELAPSEKRNTAWISVYGPSWLSADSVTIYLNGIKLSKTAIQNKNAPGLKWTSSLSLPKRNQDLYLVAIAEGKQKSLPYWPIVKPFQPTSDEWSPYVIGCSGAVWIDMDGDGKPTSAYEYADKIVTQYSKNLKGLVKRINEYDPNVAVQALSILTDRKVDLNGKDFLTAMKSANNNTRASVALFMRQWNSATKTN